MLAIKLKIVGRRNQRSFRVIVQEARSKLGGKFVEDLGWFDPHTNQFKLNKERLKYWIEHGAQPTRSAARLLAKSKADSGTETYEVREGRKRKKGEKATAEGGVEQPAEAANEAAETPEEGASEAAPAEEKAESEEKPPEEAPVNEAYPEPEKPEGSPAPEATEEPEEKEEPAKEENPEAEESTKEDK